MKQLIVLMCVTALIILAGCSTETDENQIIPPESPPSISSSAQVPLLTGFAGLQQFSASERDFYDWSAPPWDVFHNDFEVLRITEEDDAILVEVVHDRRSVALTHNTFYVFNSDTQEYIPISVSGTSSPFTGFIAGDISVRIPIDTFGTSGENAVAVYTCSSLEMTSEGLRPLCGCRAVDDCGYWSAQRVVLTEESQSDDCDICFTDILACPNACLADLDIPSLRREQAMGGQSALSSTQPSTTTSAVTTNLVCRTDRGCPRGQTCTDGVCVGQIQETTTAFTVAECRTNLGCPEGRICDGGQCVELSVTSLPAEQESSTQTPPQTTPQTEESQEESAPQTSQQQPSPQDPQQTTQPTQSTSQTEPDWPEHILQAAQQEVFNSPVPVNIFTYIDGSELRNDLFVVRATSICRSDEGECVLQRAVMQLPRGNPAVPQSTDYLNVSMDSVELGTLTTESGNVAAVTLDFSRRVEPIDISGLLFDQPVCIFTTWEIPEVGTRVDRYCEVRDSEMVFSSTRLVPRVYSVFANQDSGIEEPQTGFRFYDYIPAQFHEFGIITRAIDIYPDSDRQAQFFTPTPLTLSVRAQPVVDGVADPSRMITLHESVMLSLENQLSATTQVDMSSLEPGRYYLEVFAVSSMLANTIQWELTDERGSGVIFLLDVPEPRPFETSTEVATVRMLNDVFNVVASTTCISENLEEDCQLERASLILPRYMPSPTGQESRPIVLNLDVIEIAAADGDGTLRRNLEFSSRVPLEDLSNLLYNETICISTRWTGGHTAHCETVDAELVFSDFTLRPAPFVPFITQNSQVPNEYRAALLVAVDLDGSISWYRPTPLGIQARVIGSSGVVQTPLPERVVAGSMNDPDINWEWPFTVDIDLLSPGEYNVCVDLISTPERVQDLSYFPSGVTSCVPLVIEAEEPEPVGYTMQLIGPQTGTLSNPPNYTARVTATDSSRAQPLRVWFELQDDTVPAFEANPLWVSRIQSVSTYPNQEVRLVPSTDNVPLPDGRVRICAIAEGTEVFISDCIIASFEQGVRSCTSDSGCGSLEICEAGVCTQAQCTTNSDCEGHDQTSLSCDGNTVVSQTAVACESLRCVEPRPVRTSCRSGEVCQQGVCEAEEQQPECRTNADCAEARSFCDQGRSVATQSEVCIEGVCRSASTVPVPCDSNEYCIPGEQNPVCHREEVQYVLSGPTQAVIEEDITVSVEYQFDQRSAQSARPVSAAWAYIPAEVALRGDEQLIRDRAGTMSVPANWPLIMGFPTGSTDFDHRVCFSLYTRSSQSTNVESVFTSTVYDLEITRQPTRPGQVRVGSQDVWLWNWGICARIEGQEPSTQEPACSANADCAELSTDWTCSSDTARTREVGSCESGECVVNTVLEACPQGQLCSDGTCSAPQESLTVSILSDRGFAYTNTPYRIEGDILYVGSTSTFEYRWIIERPTGSVQSLTNWQRTQQGAIQDSITFQQVETATVCLEARSLSQTISERDCSLIDVLFGGGDGGEIDTGGPNPWEQHTGLPGGDGGINPGDILLE